MKARLLQILENQFDGDYVLYDEIKQLLAEFALKTYVDLEKAVTERDRKLLCSTSHALKSSAEAACHDDLTYTCYTLERMARSTDDIDWAVVECHAVTVSSIIKYMNKTGHDPGDMGNVLLIEPNVIAYKIISKAAEDAGFKIVEADAEQPAHVIANVGQDINISLKIKTIRARLPRTIILAMSYRDEDQDIAMASGANIFVKLPLKADKIISMLKQIAGLKTTHVLYPLETHIKTVLFADIVGFTELCVKTETIHVIRALDSLFSSMDDIAQLYNITRVCIIGDAYMATCPVASNMLSFAQDVLTFLENTNIHVRIGMHTGEVVSTMVRNAPSYYGSTVNIASRMESTGYPDCIHMSEACMNAIAEECNFSGPEEVYIKGIGMMKTYIAKHGDWKQHLSHNTTIDKNTMQMLSEKRRASFESRSTPTLP